MFGNAMDWFRDLNLKTKLMFALIPSVILTLMVTGYLTYILSCNLIEAGVERNASVQTQALASQIEEFLERVRQDILLAAQEPMNEEQMRTFIARRLSISGMKYCEFAHISPKEDGNTFLVIKDGNIISLLANRLDKIHPNPLLFVEKLPALSLGEVWISPVMEIEYPFPSENNPNRKVSSQVIRLVTPYTTPHGESGHLLLAIDARQIRDILSVYRSPLSPLRGNARGDEIVYSYMFDTEGWELFQSEDIEKKDPPLATYLARAGFEGTLGNPHTSCAFRPSSVHKNFWKMVTDVREGKDGLFSLSNTSAQDSLVRDCIQAYSPIEFTRMKGKEPIIYAGVANIDRSQLTLTAGYRHMDVMLLITLTTIVMIAGLVYLVSRVIANPIIKMTRAVSTAWSSQNLQPVDIPHSGYETNMLMNAVNKMIEQMRTQAELIQTKDEALKRSGLRQRAALDEEMLSLIVGNSSDILPEFCGISPKIEQLKADILKAARVDVDVLIVGETGTGKQLAADAIHRNSRRSGGPLICVDCGALDENLLLDTLFGHVRWAYTEAKNERKGAFLEANGGTLFLDEIQTASPKVQQALLRAVAMRKIKPLGSDAEIDVDVRIITATNVSLESLIDQKIFREDLYFRLKVISLHTPPLREHKESIPLLAIHYLMAAEEKVGKHGLGFSKGAIEKMKAYDWPGNVRELINRITNSAVMVENDVIQAEDIVLEDEELRPLKALAEALAPPPSQNSEPPQLRSPAAPKPAAPAAPPAPSASRPPSAAPAAEPLPGAVKLNARQQAAYSFALAKGSITRQDHQTLIGGDLPVRTAIHDLRDLVEKGLLSKAGQGPATHYVPVKRR
jgi:DNA-binding NtrC family response regulator